MADTQVSQSWMEHGQPGGDFNTSLLQGMPTYSRQRVIELSRPKTPRSIWITSVGPRVQWGTQEMLWPVRKEAMSAPCTQRLTILSEPKKNFSSGEKLHKLLAVESGIWRVPPPALKAEPSPRVIELAGPKQLPRGYMDDRRHHVFSCGRPSVMWEVTKPALSGRVSKALDMLARPKQLPGEFSPHRDVITEIPPAALKVAVTERIETLATPRKRPEGPFREPQWPVTDGARSATPSSRCQELARPKTLAECYLAARDIPWQVSKAARKSAPTQRLEELAVPNVRASMDHVQFDPNAFSVKQTALKSICSARIEELAQPIKR